MISLGSFLLRSVVGGNEGSDSSSTEQDVDSVCSDDGTNIDNPGEKYTGTPKKSPLVEKSPEETEELSSSESDDTLVESSSESDEYHDVDSEGNKSIGEVVPLDTQQKNEIEPDNKVNTSEDSDKHTEEVSNFGQYTVGEEAVSHIKDINDDRYADEPAFETNRDSTEEAVPLDLSETTSNEDENRDLEVINIPTEEIKGYVNDIIEGACNEIRNISDVDNNNGNEPNRHSSLNDTSLNDYDIVSVDESPAMGEGASKLEKDLSKDPSIPADISDLTEGESTSPTGDPVIIIDYKKRKFSNDDEDPIFDENETLVDSFVKKLKRDELVEDQQMPEHDSITNGSASCPPGSENDTSDCKEQRDGTSLPNYEDESTQGLDVTVDATGAPSDDDIKNVEEFVEVPEKEHLTETEAQQPPSDVQVDGESYPGKTASGETDELPAVTALVEEDFSPCTGQDDDELQSGQQKENSINESAINVQTDDDVLHEDSIVDEPGTLSKEDEENVEEVDEVIEKETLLESEVPKPSDMPVDSENDSEGTVNGDIEESLVIKAVVESDFSPCTVGDEFQNSKQQHENSLNEPVVDVVTDDVLPENSVEQFTSFTPPEQSSNEFSEPSIIIDYEPKETVSRDNNKKTDEDEKLVDNFVEHLCKLNIKDDNTGSDVSSEELDEISQGTNSKTTVDDVHGEGIHVENQINDVEENIFEESVGNSDSLREDEKSSSELVNFLSECLDLEDTHNGKEAYSPTGTIDDQSSSEPVQEQFDEEQKLTPEIPKIENFLNEIHDNKTVNEKSDNEPNDNELQSNNFPRKYSEEEVRRAIHILTSRPPYDDLDPDALYEKIHDPKFDRVFALVLAPKPKETKTRMFGLFSNPVFQPTNNALPEDLNEDDDNIPYLNNGNSYIDLSDTDDNQQITAENVTGSESRPDFSKQSIADLDEETMDVEDDDGDSLSSSSASSGMYVLEEYSAINEELDDEERELQNNSSNDDESSGSKLPAGSGKMFCVTTISDAPKQDLPHIAESENTPILHNLFRVATDSAESPTSQGKVSVLSSESDLVDSLTIPKENTPLEKDSVVETEVRIIHLSDDKVEYDEYLLHQAQNTDTTEPDDNSQKKISTNVEQLFNVQEENDNKSILTNFAEDDQGNDVEFNAFVESTPRDYLEDAKHIHHVEESVVPTNIQSSAFDPQTVDGIKWETPVESENSEKKYDFSFKVTTPTYITFKENVLPHDYEDRFVTEAEVVPSVLDPDENCPFNFDLNDEAESKLIYEPQVDVIVLGSDQKTCDDSLDRQMLLDSIADILDNTDEEQSDAESIDSHPPHFVDKQDLPMKDPHSTQALAASQPLDLTTYLPDTTEESIICPGGSSFVVVGTPCKTDETIEVQTFVDRSESSPYRNYASNERDESANSDVGEQLSSSSESLSSTEISDDEDSHGKSSDEVPYEQFENDLDYTNEGTQPTIVSDIPLSMSLPLDQLSNPSSSSGNDEDDFTHSFQEGLKDDLQGSSSGRKSSSSSSSCSSNNTAQEPGVSYEYMEEGNDDDPSQSNFFERKENTPVNRQESHEVPGKKDDHAIKAEDPEALGNVHFQVLLENETPRWYEDPVNDNLVTSDSDSIEPIVMTVYHDQQPRYITDNNECKVEELIDSQREKETESAPLIPNEHVTFNMYLEKPPMEETPVEYDEYLEFQPKDGSENLSEPEINDTATDKIEEMGEEIDESTFMAPKEDVVLSDTHSKDSADPEQPLVLTSDSDDVTPPRHRCESSSAASSFSDSDVQEEPPTNGASVVFALIGRPSLDDLHDPLLSDDHSGENFEGTPELRDEDGSPEPPVVFQGSVEVFRDESLDEVQVGSITNFQEVCHNNEEEERGLPDSEISQQSIVYYTESETHIVHQSITTIEVSRSMSPS